MGDILAAYAEGKLIHTGQKKAIAAGAFDVAVVGVGVEAVGDGNAVVNFTGKGVGCITQVVGLIGGEGVVSIVVQAVGHAVRAFNFQCLVVGFAVVEGGVESGPVLVRGALVD